MPKYTVDDIRREYSRLDALTGANVAALPIKISKRGVKRYGSCRWQMRNGTVYPVSITISDFILDCEEGFWDTIRHEYAHALVALRTGRKHGHDGVWKAACKEIGCEPSRLVHQEDAHAFSVERRAQRERYEVYCRCCLRRWRYMRKTKDIKAIEAGRPCYCKPCGSSDLGIHYLKE